MELKFSVLFGVILAVVLLAVTTVVFMVSPAYVDIAAIVTIIVLALLLTKLYVGRVKVPVSGMVATVIVWILIVAVLDIVYASAMGLDLAAYYSNYMIYAGYALMLVLALIGHRVFGGASATKAPEAAK